MKHKFKEGTQYRLIFDLKNIEFCKTMKNLEIFPWMKTFVYINNLSLPGIIPEKCPITDVGSVLV
jgi:hypothetical protein